MKKTKIVALMVMLTAVLCCCDNKKEQCNNCKSLDVSLSKFEKKFPETTVEADTYYLVDGNSFKITYSS